AAARRSCRGFCFCAVGKSEPRPSGSVAGHELLKRIALSWIRCGSVDRSVVQTRSTLPHGRSSDSAQCMALFTRRGGNILDVLAALHRDRANLFAIQADGFQIDHPDLAALVSPEIETQVREVRNAGPERIVGDFLAMLRATSCAFRNVELV